MAENVKVAVRCRPMSGREVTLGSKNVVTIPDSRTVLIANPKDPEDGGKKFTFDFAYGDDSIQQKVFEDLGLPIITRALDGFNGTIFAYGQTGSGKTHTMMGTGDDLGIVPKLQTTLFEMVNAKTSAETKFMITVSYLEIYNEVIHDLLNPTERELRIREHPDLGIYVEDLCEVVVTTEKGVAALLEQGNAVRHVAATQMNGRSSRSHSCFTLKIEQKTTTQEGSITRETSLSSKLNLVDLAGSERAAKTGAQGATLKEGAAINASLMTLGKVINALAEGALAKGTHIPYRESKLTRLLQESLGGNAATTMMAAISPADYNIDETVSTLKYASRAKSIKNEVTRNEDVNEKMIRELKDEIEKLRQQLVMGATVASPGGTVASVPDTELAERLAELERMRQQTWDDKEKLSKQLEMERANNVSSVISSAMDSVKQQKLEMMRAIKKLQNTKATLTKGQQSKRDEYQTIKAKLEKDMQRYQALQAQFETDGDEARREKLEQAMTLLLASIEKNRDSLGGLAKELNKIKADLRRTEEELTEQRAELVANVSILEANDRIRQQVAAEERAKWDAEKATFLSRELEGERTRLNEEKDEMLKEADKFKAELERALASERMLQARVLELEGARAALEEANKGLEEKAATAEGSLAENEADLETAHDEIAKLKRELADVRADKVLESEKLSTALGDMERMAQDHDQALRRARDNQPGGEFGGVHGGGRLKKGEGGPIEEYAMFKDLMGIFNDERTKMEHKYKETTTLLRKAVEDIVYLTTRNEELQAQLQHATTWEPAIL